MTDQPLKTFCQELVWNDDVESGNYFAVVIAPDQATAERLIAAEMLSDTNTTLFEELSGDEEPRTLKRYYDTHGELGSWGDIGGTACPNCTSHNGHDSGAIHAWATGQARVMECRSCGFEWAPLGFGQKRKQMEEAARAQIAALDGFEHESASDPDDDPDYDDQGNLLPGVDHGAAA